MTLNPISVVDQVIEPHREAAVAAIPVCPAIGLLGLQLDGDGYA